MEQTINFITGAISTICIGILTNYIYDKIKNHSNATKSGLELEIKIKFKKSK